MLQPKKTKFRRSQKGRMKGNAQRGNQLAFDRRLKTLEAKWITGRQIEAAPYRCDTLHAASRSGMDPHFPGQTYH